MSHSKQNNDNCLWALGGFISSLVIVLFLLLLISSVWTYPTVHVITQGVFAVIVVYTLFSITRVKPDEVL